MRKLRTTGFAVAALAVAAGATASSCGQTPTNVPIRTFEGAQKAAVVCLQVSDPNTGNPVQTPKAYPESYCAPVPSGVVGSSLAYHLVAVVTQTTRGELAVVNLTAGTVVDEDQATPGINFIPVGTNPTDVVTAPGDGETVFVSSASPTKPAIFAVPSSRLLGDGANGAVVKEPPLRLPDLRSCLLPQPPLALAVLNTPNGSQGGGDGGSMGGGGPVEAGASSADGGTGPKYQLLALLEPSGGASAKVVVIDPATLVAATTPGSLPPCAITGTVALSAAVPTTWSVGPAWPDGVPYVEGGAGDLSANEPATCPASVSSGGPGAAPDASDSGVVNASATDGGVDEDGAPGEPSDDAAVVESGLDGATAPDAGLALDLLPGSAPTPVSMIMRDDAPVLYVADSSIPVIHVIDLADPSAIVERAPLLATSVIQPGRLVQVGNMALSPPTRDYTRYLYAIDTIDGSLMVFDVTDPRASDSPHVPLVRPHAELNPFAPPDRLTFGAPVAAVAFAQHDWPLILPSNTNQSQAIAYQGLLCNPNPRAGATVPFADLGAYYRADQAGLIQQNNNATVLNFPSRLRGVFAFATLTNGTVITVDVDDWDAPCRRPDPMTADAGMTGSLDLPEAPSTQDVDPYHAPNAYQAGVSPSPVTLEQFFPVSAPHRIRSGVLLRNDPTTGNHLSSVTPPQLSDLSGATVVVTGKGHTAAPLLLPPALDPGFADPTLVKNPTEPNPSLRSTGDAGTVPNGSGLGPAPGVRLSFEDPTVQQAQDWTVTYEGVLPSSSGIFATIASAQSVTGPGAYATLEFATQGANLCGLGIEDWSLGQVRANDALAEMNRVSNSKDVLATLPQWTADYVEITDDILPRGDMYWTVKNPCWAATQAPDVVSGKDVATARYNLCQATFGAPGSNADLDLNRDAPILAAYRDHLIVGRFGHSSKQPERTQNRTIDPGSANNPAILAQMACCFHNQAAFKVRAGGEWIAVGTQSGLLHHVVAAPSSASEPDRCVLACDPRNRLLNSRSFDVPWTTPPTCAMTSPIAPIGRNSPLAMRNPMFSYVTWAGCGPMKTDDHTSTARDLTWKFSINGGFSPLAVSLGGTSGAAVSPQSMLFIRSLGQLAVVDGAAQGLVLIDLNTVGFGSNYF